MFRNGLEPWHIIVIAVVILLLFGSKKMPDIARSFGRSARILRSEVEEMKNDKNPRPEATPQTDQKFTSETHNGGNAAGPVPEVPTGTAPSVPVKDPADHNTSA